ncbi:MAG: hypothetical protein KDI36_13260 [Pseudomonadales bacterium]|nr:hypothetical protein [Pseudomonadales bacterium]
MASDHRVNKPAMHGDTHLETLVLQAQGRLLGQVLKITLALTIFAMFLIALVPDWASNGESIEPLLRNGCVVAALLLMLTGLNRGYINEVFIGVVGFIFLIVPYSIYVEAANNPTMLMLLVLPVCVAGFLPNRRSFWLVFALNAVLALGTFWFLSAFQHVLYHPRSIVLSLLMIVLVALVIDGISSSYRVSLRESLARAEDISRVMIESTENQRLESLGMLASGIAHDFSNFLQLIMTNTELGRKHANDPAALAGHLQAIRETSVAAAELCDQLLAYAGKKDSTPEPVSLNQVVEGMQQLIAVTLPDNVRLQLSCEAQNPVIKGDVSQIRQIILNLMMNAVDSLDQGGFINIRTAIRVLAQNEVAGLSAGTYGTVTVADSGQGMDQETLRRAFDPFFSTKVNGRGLGLAAARGIALSHGGELIAFSQPGAGSTFELVVPLSHEVPASHGLELAAENLWQQTGQVLFLEAGEEVRLLGQRVLEEAGLQVVTGSSARRADWEPVISDYRPDLIIIDTSLSLTGTELEEAGGLANIPRLYVSEVGDFPASMSEAHGPRAVLRKPYLPEQLLTEVQKLLSVQQIADHL